MLKKGQYYPDQVRDEKVVAFVKQHPLAILLPSLFCLILFLVCAGLMIYFVFVPNDFVNRFYNNTTPNLQIKYWAVTLLGILWLIVTGYFIRAWICYYFNVLILTSDHLVDVRQIDFFNRKVSEQSLLRVQDVSSRMRGLLQTYFRFGTVYVETAGEAPNFIMPNIPHPYKMSNTIMKLHEEIVEKGGLQGELAEGEGVVRPKIKPENTASGKEEAILLEPQADQQSAKPRIIDKIKKRIHPEEYYNESKENLIDLQKKSSQDEEILNLSDNSTEGMPKVREKPQKNDSQEGELQDGKEIKFE